MNAKGWTLLLAILILGGGRAGASVVEEYLDRYFEMFPSSATAAGRYDLDHQLEDLSPDRRTAWVSFNRGVVSRVKAELDSPETSSERRLDLELVLAEAERQIFDFDTIDGPGRNPLFWTGIMGNATVFLLVRDDRPLADRLERAAGRAALIPRLVAQARSALETSALDQLAAELCGMAEWQARSTARFYRDGFPLAGADLSQDLQAKLELSGTQAAAALSEFADFLASLKAEATGSPRLGDLYSERFRLTTGIEDPVGEVLAEAEQALQSKVEETAEYGRSIWSEVFAEDPVPVDDAEVIRLLFARVSQDRAENIDEFVDDYRTLVDRSVEFVRRQDLITLPEPLTLYLDRSPSYFIGQSVGGVYPAGPYAPADAKTLLFLPSPPDDATEEQRDAFFRDFNHHFNLMITPHELIPGHYLQLKFAAQHPHKVRALFGDGVYIEGWGTFCERLMLDLGWGGPLDRMAHLKKQLENIARAIVDIRVHTREMSRDEVLMFVQQEAFQDEQFAGNMWRRAITSSPQLTTYYLGYREVWGLYDDVRKSRGSEFELKQFMDGMMELGPVAVEHYRNRMLSGS